MKLKQKDLVNVYSKIFPNGDSRKFCKLLFNLIDFDRSKKLDFAKFLIALSLASEKDFRQKLRMIFNLIDVNKDGLVKRKEITQVMICICELLDKSTDKREQTQFKVNAFFRLVKLNDENFMTEDEFIEANLKDPFIINFIY